MPHLLPSSLLSQRASFLKGRRLCMCMCCSSVVILTLATGLVNIDNPRGDVGLMVGSICVFIVVLFFVKCLCHEVALSATLFNVVVIARISAVLRAVGYTCAPSRCRLVLVIKGVPVFALGVLFSVVTCLGCAPCVLKVVDVNACMTYVVVANGSVLDGFFKVFLTVFTISYVLNCQLMRGVHSLRGRGASLGGSRRRFFSLLKRGGRRIETCFRLTSKEGSLSGAGTLLRVTKRKVQRCVVRGMGRCLTIHSAKVLRVRALFPRLSTSRQRMYLLVLRKGSLGRIYTVLNGGRKGIADAHARVHEGLGLRPSSGLHGMLRREMGGGR